MLKKKGDCQHFAYPVRLTCDVLPENSEVIISKPIFPRYLLGLRVSVQPSPHANSQKARIFKFSFETLAVYIS